MPGLRPPEISDSTSAIATAANSSGTQMPSLSPLSTLSPWRMRCGTRGSVTTACPSAASVGASTTARITASSMLSSPKTAAAATAPSAIVSGRPMPEQPHRHVDRAAQRTEIDARRVGEQHQRERRLRQRRARSSSCSRGRSRRAPSGPTSSPKATNRIAGVIGVPDSRRETAATPSSASATSASAHSISAPHAGLGRHGHARRALPGRLPEDPAVVSAVLAPIAAVVAAVLAPVVTVLDDRGGSDEPPPFA